MQYKTIVLELLQQAPETHERLRESRMLLSTLEQLAIGLKACHEEWKKQLMQNNPESSAAQLSSVALEMAVSELEAALLPATPDEDGLPYLDGLMAYLRSHSLPA